MNGRRGLDGRCRLNGRCLRGDNNAVAGGGIVRTQVCCSARYDVVVVEINLFYSLAVVAACLVVREWTDCTVVAYCGIESITEMVVVSCIMT